MRELTNYIIKFAILTLTTFTMKQFITEKAEQTK